MSLLLVLWTVAAEAHTLWPTHYSAQSTLAFDDEHGLRATVVFEVPAFEMVNRFRQHFSDIDLLAEIEAGRFEPLEEEFQRVQYAAFAEALYLEINGQEAEGSWRRAESANSGAGTQGFSVYALEFVFRQALRTVGSRLEARLLNNALIDESVVMANFADAGDGWKIAQSSIPPPEVFEGLPEGAEIADELAMWTMDPAKRDLLVVFERQSVDR